MVTELHPTCTENLLWGTPSCGLIPATQDTIQNIPVGQFFRLKRLCSLDVDFKQEALHMASRFEKRGTPSLLSIGHLTLLTKLHVVNYSQRNPLGKAYMMGGLVSLCAFLFSPHHIAWNLIVRKIITKYLPVLSKVMLFMLRYFPRRFEPSPGRHPDLVDGCPPVFIQAHEHLHPGYNSKVNLDLALTVVRIILSLKRVIQFFQLR